MALITQHVKERSEKCKTCVLQNKSFVLQKFRKYMETGMEGGGRTAIDKESAKQFLKLSYVIEKVGCNLCPYRKDFEKVYGQTPLEYFMQKELMEIGVR